MPINNVQVVNFSNNRGRPFADALEQTYQTAKRFQQEYTAVGGDVAVPNNAEVVVDGSESDGRKVITAAQLRALLTAANDVVTWFETGSPSRIARIQQITVNGQARF